MTRLPLPTERLLQKQHKDVNEMFDYRKTVDQVRLVNWSVCSQQVIVVLRFEFPTDRDSCELKNLRSNNLKDTHSSWYSSFLFRQFYYKGYNCLMDNVLFS